MSDKETDWGRAEWMDLGAQTIFDEWAGQSVWVGMISKKNKNTKLIGTLIRLSLGLVDPTNAPRSQF